MSDFNAIADASATLRSLLETAIDQDAAVSGLVGAESVSLDSPANLLRNGTPDCVSLFLYRVSENPDLKNRPPVRLESNVWRQTPLALDLHFLVSVLIDDAIDSQRLLGKVMQTLYDHAVIRGSLLQGGLSTAAEELRVTLAALTLEEVAEVWGTFSQPYRLCVPYIVKAVFLESARTSSSEPVRVKRLNFVSAVETEGGT